MGRAKINAELEQIIHGDMDIMFRKRVAWANARGRRIEFIEKLKEEGVTGKEYSRMLIEFDKENMSGE